VWAAFPDALQGIAASPGTPNEALSVSAPNPQELLAHAVRTLESRRSVSARLLVGVNLYGEQMIGSGSYREEVPARSRRLRLEINLQHGDQVSRVLKICDGKRFWDYQQIFLDRPPRLACYDVGRIEQALRNAGRTNEPWPLTAGIVKLLRSLRDVFVFDRIQAGRLDQIPVWRLDGVWRPEWLMQMVPDQKKLVDQNLVVDPTLFGPQQPDRITLYLGQDDLFPYRMECSRSPKNVDPQSPDAGRTVLVYLQMAEVEIDVPLDPAHFNYNPGDIKFADTTDAFLRLRNLRD
jgi:hypothetical protein